MLFDMLATVIVMSVTKRFEIEVKIWLLIWQWVQCNTQNVVKQNMDLPKT